MERQIEHDYEELEAACRKMISAVLLICEAELAKRNDDDKALPHAAMAIRESIMTFLALIREKSHS